ncbi:hypothetical protein [Wolbachia endosymbiont (group A) of Ischnus inquisitorius]|uniref:hypothetical protein n=1 Tax=Wolbachia endosymbiont (group A) of Ischnus inquisitorius TaxID=3077922 RepID=UPI0031333E1B
MIGNLYNKNNAPYFIAGALATLVLLASGTLAVAPYVKFLSSVAAFNVALPVALSLSILSILVLALSCKIISNNVELEAKVKGQLEHKEEMLSLEHQELRDENTRLNERVDSLMEELCQCKLESEKNKLCLKSEYEDELLLRLEYEGELNLELEHKSREASSLRTQLTMLRKKVEVEEVKQLKTLESEEQHESSESDIEELEKKLCQSEKEKKELEGKVSDERQKRTDLESKVDKLYTKEKEYLSKIKELEKELSSLKEDEEELVDESMRANDDLKETANKFKEKEREYVTKAVFTVLDVVEKRVEQELSDLEEQQYIQDTGHIQKGVDVFMQPIYRKLNIDNQQKLNDCTTTLKQLQDLLAPCDSGYASRRSTPINSH